MGSPAISPLPLPLPTPPGYVTACIVTDRGGDPVEVEVAGRVWSERRRDFVEDVIVLSARITGDGEEDEHPLYGFKLTTAEYDRACEAVLAEWEE